MLTLQVDVFCSETPVDADEAAILLAEAKLTLAPTHDVPTEVADTIVCKSSSIKWMCIRISPEPYANLSELSKKNCIAAPVKAPVALTVAPVSVHVHVALDKA